MYTCTYFNCKDQGHKITIDIVTYILKTFLQGVKLSAYSICHDIFNFSLYSQYITYLIFYFFCNHYAIYKIYTLYEYEGGIFEVL